MADQKISAMPSASTLTGAELVPMVQSGANVQITLNALAAAKRAYGGFSSSSAQSGSISAGAAMTFTGTDVADGITLSSGSRLVVPNTGKYNLQFSAQLENVENTQQDVIIWFRVNGFDVANSATKVTVHARKNAGVNGYLAAAWNIFLPMNAGDYAQIMWLPSIATLTLQSLPASLSPAYPAIPSVIATMSQVG